MWLIARPIVCLFIQLSPCLSARLAVDMTFSHPHAYSFPKILRAYPTDVSISFTDAWEVTNPWRLRACCSQCSFHITSPDVNVMMSNITFLMIFSAVFDQSPLILWINCSFYYIYLPFFLLNVCNASFCNSRKF